MERMGVMGLEREIDRAWIFRQRDRERLEFSGLERERTREIGG